MAEHDGTWRNIVLQSSRVNPVATQGPLHRTVKRLQRTPTFSRGCCALDASNAQRAANGPRFLVDFVSNGQDFAVRARRAQLASIAQRIRDNRSAEADPTCGLRMGSGND